MEHSTLDPDDLLRPDWNSLKKNYDKHDISEAYLKGVLHENGYVVENYGIDMRDHDDHLIFDDKMDLRVWDGDGTTVNIPSSFSGSRYVEEHVDPNDPNTIHTEEYELRGTIDVKAKANDDWLGITNVRHLAHYAAYASSTGTVAMIYFSMVDPDAREVGEQDMFVEVPTDWGWAPVVDHYDESISLSGSGIADRVLESDSISRVFRAPDQNMVAAFDDSVWMDTAWAMERLEA